MTPEPLALVLAVVALVAGLVTARDVWKWL